MKILMVAPQPFFEPRGTPISVYQRLEALSGLGHHVDLLTYHIGEDISFPNLRIIRVMKVGFIKHVRIGPSRAKILLDVLLFLKALWLLLWRPYDVIHSHEEAAFFCVLLAALFRKRHLYDMHSILSRQLGHFNFGNNPLIIKIFERLERSVLKSCDAVITVGADLEEYAQKVNPCVPRIKIDNVALQAYQTLPKTESIEALKEKLNLVGKTPIVYTGTFEAYQGLDMALQSARLVRKQIPSAVFLFVGTKREQAKIWARKSRDAGVSEFTMFLDAVPPEDAMVFLACGSVLISPRISGSTTPLKIYSYLHSGKPIVATNISAHTQVLNPQIACLVDPTPQAFAEGIIKTLSHPEIGTNLGKNAHNYAHKNFNYENYRAKVDQIYRYLNGDRPADLRVDMIDNVSSGEAIKTP